MQKVKKKIRLLLRYGQGVAGLNKNDVILTSFPKSGNTWVRYFFANLISQIYWEGKVVDFSLLDKTMPEIGVSNLIEKWKFPVVPRIVKTHNNYWPLYRNNYTILIIRDPKDVMVSRFYFEKKKKVQEFNGDFQTFIRSEKYGLKSWFNYYSSWEDHADTIIQFEDLKSDDMTVFKKMIYDNLGLEISEELVENAVLKSRFEEFRRIEEKYGHSKPGKYKEDYNFTRKGKKGGWKDHFNEEDLDYYRELKQNYGLKIY